MFSDKKGSFIKLTYFIDIIIKLFNNRPIYRYDKGGYIGGIRKVLLGNSIKRVHLSKEGLFTENDFPKPEVDLIW